MKLLSHARESAALRFTRVGVEKHSGWRRPGGVRRDWPVVTLNPWEGVQTAVTRQTAEGTPEAGFVPEQWLTVALAVDGHTLGAAFAGRRDKTEGSLETGKLADLIIISQNIFDINPHKIGATKVGATIVGGRLVYQADSKPAEE